MHLLELNYNVVTKNIFGIRLGYLNGTFSLISPALCKSGKFLKNYYCVSDCGPGFYGNSVTRKCEKCSSSCRTCLDGEVPTKCSSCDSPLYIQGIVVKLKSAKERFSIEGRKNKTKVITLA